MSTSIRFVLPPDVMLTPVDELPVELREKIGCGSGEFALTRPRSRTVSRVVDAGTVSLLNGFRQPATIVEAVVQYSRANRVDPEQTLEEALPLIGNLVAARLLLPSDQAAGGPIELSLHRGDRIGDHRIVRDLQLMEDTEIWQVVAPDGRPGVLKLARDAKGATASQLRHEARVLRHLGGSLAPELLDEGVWEDRRYLVMGWCPGVPATTAAGNLRRMGTAAARRELLALCCEIAGRYGQLHAAGVLHSDIHPGNLLVGAAGEVQLVDFGLARVPAVPELSRVPRGGVSFYYEPEFARAALEGHPPPSSFAGEQYAVAALLYELLTGCHYLDFVLERTEMFRQILEDPPVPLAARGEGWPAGLEAVLERALAKRPEDRFGSMAALAAALRDVLRSTSPALAESTVAPSHRRSLAMLEARWRARLEPFGPLHCEALPAPRASVNAGAAGIAWALARMAVVQEDAERLSLAGVWSRRALEAIDHPAAFYDEAAKITREDVGEISIYHTASGVFATHALIGHLSGDVAAMQLGVQGFLAASSRPCSVLDLTLGRSSTLLGCTMLYEALREPPVLAYGREVFAGIWGELEAMGPIEAAPIAYLGIAHGWAGLLYAALRWCRASGDPLPEGLEGRLQELAALAEPSGRGLQWPCMLTAGRPDAVDGSMPGWCNGSAGYVHLWTEAAEVLSDSRWSRLAEGAAWNTWDAADPLPNLCCGLAGRAWSLLHYGRRSGEKVWLERGVYLAGLAAGAVLEAPPTESGLYKGELGPALLAVEAQRPELAVMPFFEGEGW